MTTDVRHGKGLFVCIAAAPLSFCHPENNLPAGNGFLYNLVVN
jgi:hypothetical protein